MTKRRGLFTAKEEELFRKWLINVVKYAGAGFLAAFLSASLSGDLRNALWAGYGAAVPTVLDALYKVKTSIQERRA